MLYHWIRNYVKRYSFITRVEFKNAIFFMYYKVDGQEKVKKLPYRADKNQLQDRIETIKKEIDYCEQRQERSKKVLEEIKNERRETIPFGHS